MDIPNEDVKLALPVLAALYSVVACATCPEWAPWGLPNWVSGSVLGHCSPRSVRALGPAAEVGVVAGRPSLVEWLSIGHHEVTWATPRLGVAVVFCASWSVCMLNVQVWSLLKLALRLVCSGVFLSRAVKQNQK